MPASGTTLLLPAAECFGAQRLDTACGHALARADRLPSGEAGTQAQLRRHFDLPPGDCAIAALTRQADAGDATGAAWLRADPAHVRPDINGVRLLACGDSLGLTAEDSTMLLPALVPLFTAAGCPVDAPSPSRWYLRLPVQARLPGFIPPGEALGGDLFDLQAEGAEARHWRGLLNEAQIVLHNHPWNAHRAERGLAPVNSLWFWGGGTLPSHVRTSRTCIISDDEALRALAQAAGAQAEALQPFPPDGLAGGLIDLRARRDLRQLADDWLAPALSALADGRLSALELDLEDGVRYRLTHRQRWRFWRRPQASLMP